MLLGIKCILDSPLLSPLPCCHRLEVGPVAFLVTIIVLIYVNLGTRRPGEASAYSIFNNFVRLPGQLTAEALDDQIRLGHM